MKTSIKKLATPTLVAAGLVLLNGSARAFVASQYEVVDMGTYNGGTKSYAVAVNDLGHVAGHAMHIVNGVERPRGYWWNGSTKVMYPQGASELGSYCTGINNSDILVGYAQRDYIGGTITDEGFKWKSGQFDFEVPNLMPGGGSNDQFDCRPMDINDAGVITGYANGASFTSTWKAFKILVSPITNLGSLTGVSTHKTYAFGINSDGDVAGYGDTNSSINSHAFRTNNNTLINLGLFPNPLIFEDDFESFGQDINDSDTVVGYYKVDFNTFRAFGRTTSSYFDLGKLPGGTDDDSNYAHAINNDGVIVGMSEVGNANHRAIAWFSNRGTDYLVDLNDRIDPNTPWTLEVAQDISNTGYICGTGKINGQTHGYLLIPTVHVSGKLTLQDWGGSLPATVQMQILDKDTDAVLETLQVPVQANGNYSFTSKKPGVRKVRVKYWHWLGEATQYNIENNIGALNFSLLNGDINQDNAVDLLDYDIFSDYYDLNNSSVFWFFAGPNGFRVMDADLDGDLSVTLLDYDIFSKNFDKQGE